MEKNHRLLVEPSQYSDGVLHGPSSDIRRELESAGHLRLFDDVDRETIVQGVEHVRYLAEVGLQDMPAKIQQMTDGPGLVTKIAPQYSYSELVDFNFNNYRIYFWPDDVDIANLYRDNRPAYQRFAIMYPELTRYLTDIASDALKRDAGHPEKELIANTIIASSYDYMRELIDIHDPDIYCNGTIVSPVVLCQ